MTPSEKALALTTHNIFNNISKGLGHNYLGNINLAALNRRSSMRAAWHPRRLEYLEFRRGDIERCKQWAHEWANSDRFKIEAVNSMTNNDWNEIYTGRQRLRKNFNEDLERADGERRRPPPPPVFFFLPRHSFKAFISYKNILK